jgi:arylsulfatase A-like enzyme
MARRYDQSMRGAVATVILGATAAVAVATAAVPNSAKPPNILLITVDTLRADHLSAYGYHVKTSPYIDALAAEGVRFARDYTTIPLTGPSHLSMLTGRYPQEIGVLRNGVGPSDNEATTPLPLVLKKYNYRRAAFISAWPLTSHLTHLDRWFNHFDEDLGRRYQLFNSSRYAEDVTPRAMKWLQAHYKGKKPFFLWVHYFDPHSPYIFRDYFQPKARKGIAPVANPWRDDDMSQRIRDYDSEIYYTDHYIGQLLTELETLGLKDSTLVVLTGDHGESLGGHGYVGHGRHLYESTLHVPLIFRWPGHVVSGKVVQTPVSSVDLAPTILDVALGNWKGAKDHRLLFSGRSYAAALEGPSEPAERRIYFVTFAGKKGFMPNWLSWVWVQDGDLPLAFGHLDGSTKVVWRPEDQKLRVEDIVRDPLEVKPELLHSGADQYKVETAALKRWISLTERRGAEQKLSTHDREVLKSLGYAQ